MGASLRISDHQRNNARDYYIAAVILLYNALRFRWLKLNGLPLRPAVLSLALTQRCNSHCIMCNIWKRSGEISNIQSMELSKKEIIDLLSKPLFSELVELDLTGGEPHLRNDLVDIILEVAALKKSSLPKLKSIIITSNGLLPELIISNYRRILAGIRGTGIDLVSVSSFDGIGGTHDLVRGTKGAFELVSKTIAGLMEIRKEYPNFFTGIKTTILPQNVGILDDILDFALANNLFHIISPVFFTAGRFRNMDKRDKLILGDAEYQRILEFYRRDELKMEYYYAQASRFLSTGRRRWTCTAGYNYLFIEFDGKVYPCEMTSEPIGDLRKQDIETLWKSTSFRRQRKRMEHLGSCRTCHEPGAIRYSACTEGLSYYKFLMKLGKPNYRETLYREGYSKYFG